MNQFYQVFGCLAGVLTLVTMIYCAFDYRRVRIRQAEEKNLTDLTKLNMFMNGLQAGVIRDEGSI
jgi:Na+/melibiose symporter-like transporter